MNKVGTPICCIARGVSSLKEQLIGENPRVSMLVGVAILLVSTAPCSKRWGGEVASLSVLVVGAIMRFKVAFLLRRRDLDLQ